MRIHQFFRYQDEAAFLSYLRLKYAIFVQEFGFTSIKHNAEAKRACPDKYDDQGYFTTVMDDRERMVGMVRSLIIHGSFPHQELFAHHGSVFPLHAPSGLLSTVNALAVIADLRKKNIDPQWTQNTMTIGRLLMFLAVEWLRESGVMAVLVSSNPILARELLLPMGFQVLDPIFSYEFSPLPVVNLALLMNSKVYLEAASYAAGKLSQQLPSPLEHELKTYMNERHACFAHEVLSFELSGR
jgi:hypothetical protein